MDARQKVPTVQQLSASPFARASCCAIRCYHSCSAYSHPSAHCTSAFPPAYNVCCVLQLVLTSLRQAVSDVASIELRCTPCTWVVWWIYQSCNTGLPLQIVPTGVLKTRKRGKWNATSRAAAHAANARQKTPTVQQYALSWLPQLALHLWCRLPLTHTMFALCFSWFWQALVRQ